MKYEISTKELETLVSAISDTTVKTLSVGQIFQPINELIQLYQVVSVTKQDKTTIELNLLQNAINIISDGSQKNLSAGQIFAIINGVQRLKPFIEEQTIDEPVTEVEEVQTRRKRK